MGLLRKRLDAQIIIEANEYLLSAKADKNDDDKNDPPCGGSSDDKKSSKEAESQNCGTLILDATCAPANIRYPHDYSLLNEAREKLEAIIIRFCKAYGFKYPRMYRVLAHKNYLTLSKSRKVTAKKVRAVIRKQLSYLKRDLACLESYMSSGYAPNQQETKILMVIKKLYEQQKYMYDKKVHSVPNRIVSLSKRCYGMGAITTRLKETQLASIALSILVANIFRLRQLRNIVFFYLYKIFKVYKCGLSPRLA